ncbi:MAG TPA: hypothetical protein VIQ29_04410 [Ancylobacter sp.]
MKALTLEDLTRDELLAWLKLQPQLFRVRQADLLSVRQATLRDRATALSCRYDDAVSAQIRAMKEWLDCKGSPRDRLKAETIYLDFKDREQKAAHAEKAARKAADACWAALEAAWAEEAL